MTRYLLVSCLALVVLAHAGRASSFSLADLQPVFVGAEDRPTIRSNVSTTLRLTYMTARQMQQMVAALTGYSHPAFVIYEDALGKYDPQTGMRTVERPNFISIFLMTAISKSVAEAVILRETFLDDEERIVFQGINLEQTPTDAELTAFIDMLFASWLALPGDSGVVTNFLTKFRAVEAEFGTLSAYGEFLATFLQNGGIYYY